VTDEQRRLAHHQAETAAREATIRAPSAQPRPESHTEAMATAHEGRPTVAAQQKKDWRVFP
jgi:hypothetical protein